MVLRFCLRNLTSFSVLRFDLQFALMSSFDVLAWNESFARHESNSVKLTPPIETGAFWTRESSSLGGRYLYGDKSGLPEFKQCELPVGLSEGYPERFLRKPENVLVGVETVLEAMLAAKIEVWNYGVITFRNNLNKICGTLIDRKQAWTIDSCCLSTHPQTIFLDIQKTEDEEVFPDRDKFSYYGYHFEHLMTGQEPTSPVDSTSEFAVVVETKLNELSCAIAGEVDCYDPNEVGLRSFIELKTSRAPENRRKEQNVKRYKYPKWWFQSAILGVPKVVVGYWKDDGMLTTVETLNIEDLPRTAKRGVPTHMVNELWQTEQLLSFLLTVLEWMRTVVKEERGVHFRFTFVPCSRLIAGTAVLDGDLIQRIQQTLQQ